MRQEIAHSPSGAVFTLSGCLMVNRPNFAKQLAAARALLELSRMDLASRARVGHESVARAERGEETVTINTLAAIQRALEEAGIEFPEGTLAIAVRYRGHGGLSGCSVVADPSMPSGTRFQ